jgi:hypothetical protein
VCASVVVVSMIVVVRVTKDVCVCAYVFVCAYVCVCLGSGVRSALSYNTISTGRTRLVGAVAYMVLQSDIGYGVTE